MRQEGEPWRRSRPGRRERHGILTQAWSPLGGIPFSRDSGHTGALEDLTITALAENIDVFPFGLSADELTALDGLHTGRRGGPEPEAVTLETFSRGIPEA